MGGRGRGLQSLVCQLWMDYMLVSMIHLSILTAKLTDGRIRGIGVFQNYYQTHQLSRYSPSIVAWISSVETCIMFIWVGQPWPVFYRQANG